MSFQIKIQNDLPQAKIAEIKVEITYGKLQDDIRISKTYTSKYIGLNSKELIIDTKKDINNIKYVNVYILYGIMAYVYKFHNISSDMCIVVSQGENSPVVRIDNKKIYRRDETCLCNPCLLCCCCSITALLDDIEQAEHDASECTIS